MALTNFKGIQEMGIIAGGGMLICLVPMMTMLPVLLLRGKQNVLDHKWPAEKDRRARIERLWLERPIVVGYLTAGLCVLALTQFRRVYFDYNLLHMQSPGLPSVEYTMKFLESGSNSVLFAAVISDSVPKAIELENRLTNLTTVGSVKSMAHFLSGEPPEKLVKIGEIKREVSSIQFAEPEFSPCLRTGRTFFVERYLGLALEEVRRQGDKTLEENLRCLRIAVEDFRQRLAYVDQRSTSTSSRRFSRPIHRFARDFRHIETTEQSPRYGSEGFTGRAEEPFHWPNRQVSSSGLSERKRLAARSSGSVRQRVADSRSQRDRDTGSIVRVYDTTKRQLHRRGVVRAGRNHNPRVDSFSFTLLCGARADASSDWDDMDGWTDGLARYSIQPCQHYDPAACHRHRLQTESIF